MASKVKHNFKESALALLRGDWCNRVGRRVSYWMGINGVDVTMPETPSENDPIKVGLNVPNAAKILAGEMLSKNLLGMGTGGTPPLTMNAAFDDSGTYTGLQVFLPSLTIGLFGAQWTITGVTAIAEASGWYNLPSSVKSGTVGLRLAVAENAQTHAKTYTATFVGAEPTNALFYPVATVTADGQVTQYAAIPSARVTENSGNSVTARTAQSMGTFVSDGVPTGEALQTDRWYLGKGGNGAKLLVISREKYSDDLLSHLLFWREAYISNAGNIYEISEEKGCLQIVA